LTLLHTLHSRSLFFCDEHFLFHTPHPLHHSEWVCISHSHLHNRHFIHNIFCQGYSIIPITPHPPIHILHSHPQHMQF
jgi:hypothetical protein